MERPDGLTVGELHVTVAEVFFLMAVDDGSGERPLPVNLSLDGSARLEFRAEAWSFRRSRNRTGLRFDANGRYRPLPSAVGLQAGWQARDRLERLPYYIDAVYPLATTHIQQQRDGELRVVSLDEVFARQSGRYRIAAELDPAGREAAVTALCSRCVKTPMWTEPPVRDAALPKPNAQRPTPSGQWPIPCPEPCSVMLSLCREAALWQREPPAPAPGDDAVPFAAFDRPGNAIREDYLRTRYAGPDVER
jgi:sirohydrochlorin cobaltochelatase